MKNLSWQLANSHPDYYKRYQWVKILKHFWPPYKVCSWTCLAKSLCNDLNKNLFCSVHTLFTHTAVWSSHCFSKWEIFSCCSDHFMAAVIIIILSDCASNANGLENQNLELYIYLEVYIKTEAQTRSYCEFNCCRWKPWSTGYKYNQYLTHDLSHQQQTNSYVKLNLWETGHIVLLDMRSIQKTQR